MRPGGFKFRKQPPLGPYALDFYCRQAGLAIEVDGISHEMGDRPGRDKKRDDWLAQLGIETLRIPAREIIELALAQALQHPPERRNA
jgi:very-short-patch-repair endonuclease